MAKVDCGCGVTVKALSRRMAEVDAVLAENAAARAELTAALGGLRAAVEELRSGPVEAERVVHGERMVIDVG